MGESIVKAVIRNADFNDSNSPHFRHFPPGLKCPECADCYMLQERNLKARSRAGQGSYRQSMRLADEDGSEPHPTTDNNYTGSLNKFDRCAVV